MKHSNYIPYGGAMQRATGMTGKIAPPSDDKRWRLVEATMRKGGNEPHALIETLHTVQNAFGYLEEESLRYVAQSLHLPLSKVYGVATFYHYFTLKPQGEHSCVICLGTACYIKGAATLLAEVEKVTGVHAGETTPDNKVSVLVAHCLGACGLAPAAVMDGDVVGKLPPAEAGARVKGWIDNAS
jgi:bidirectional [NiFe] hydrogenase diaphorase subunit